MNIPIFGTYYNPLWQRGDIFKLDVILNQIRGIFDNIFENNLKKNNISNEDQNINLIYGKIFKNFYFKNQLIYIINSPRVYIYIFFCTKQTVVEWVSCGFMIPIIQQEEFLIQLKGAFISREEN